MARTIGIDLGTTNSVVSALVAGKPETLLNSEGGRLTPSVVAFTKDGQVLVGEPARRQAVTNPERTFRSVKRKMGSNWYTTVDKDRLTAVDLSAHILRKLKADAERQLGGEVSRAVIAVPARFNDAQRQATREAGEQAGLEVLRLLSEPAAAAFAYHLDRRSESNALVFDLGGGTFDVAVLRISGGVFDVRSTAGDTELGGDDFDRALIEHIVDFARATFGLSGPLLADPSVAHRVRDAAEQAKIELSSRTDTTVNLPFLTAGSSGDPVHLEMNITRETFEELTAPLVASLRSPFTRALADASLSVPQLNDIVMVGGASQIPAVMALLGRMTGGRNLYRGANPSEAVAAGAALNAGVIQGEVKDVLLLDVTPLSLGIETRGGSTHRIIDRNTTIPTRRTEVFTTAADEQSAVEIHVVQGERALAVDNSTLGRFTLAGIPKAPRGVPQIRVTFDVDTDGIMHVSAVDSALGTAESLLITSGTRVNRDKAEKMVADALDSRDEDDASAADLRLRQQAETLVHQVQRALRSYGPTIDPHVYANVADAMNTLQATLDGRTAPGQLVDVKDAMVHLRERSALLSNAIFLATNGTGRI